MSSEALMPKYDSNPTSVGPRVMGRPKSTSVSSGAIRRPAPAEMPLADTAGPVPVVAEQGGDRGSSVFDEGRGVSIPHGPLPFGPPVVTAGQDAVAGGCADGGRRVCVAEGHPLRPEPVYVGRAEGCVRVQAGHIAVSHIVGKNVDEVRALAHGYGSFRAERRESCAANCPSPESREPYWMSQAFARGPWRRRPGLDTQARIGEYAALRMRAACPLRRSSMVERVAVNH